MNNKTASLVIPLAFIAGLWYEHIRLQPQIQEAVIEESKHYAIALFECNNNIMESEKRRVQEQISCREYACYDTLEIVCLKTKYPKSCIDKLGYACSELPEGE